MLKLQMAVIIWFDAVSGQPQTLLAVMAGGGSIVTADSQGAYPIHYAVQGCREPTGEGMEPWPILDCGEC